MTDPDSHEPQEPDASYGAPDDGEKVDGGNPESAFGAGESNAEQPKEGAASAEEAAAPLHRSKGWVLAKDVLVFQGKLALDALRDLILSPISIVAAIFGAITSPNDPGKYFYDLMRWGRRSDHFIGLFSAGQDPSERDQFTSVDDIVDTLEKVVVDEHERGGMTEDAKAHVEETLGRIDEATHADRRWAKYQVKRIAAKARREVRKVRSRFEGPPSV